jgi:hypothetical protein
VPGFRGHSPLKKPGPNAYDPLDRLTWITTTQGLTLMQQQNYGYDLIGGNLWRDRDNPGDIALGNQAAADAYVFRFYNRDVGTLADMIRRLGPP